MKFELSLSLDERHNLFLERCEVLEREGKPYARPLAIEYTTIFRDEGAENSLPQWGRLITDYEYRLFALESEGRK